MRTLLVTGATGLLGTAVVPSLTSQFDCVALYRNEETFLRLREVAPRVSGVQADLDDAASVRKAISMVGRPYGLVHLAGGWARGTISETTDETWSQMLQLNLTDAFVAIRETLAVMDRGSDGRIIAISSEASIRKAAETLAYTVSKNGLNVLIELVAKELRGTRITANAILPPTLDDTMTRAVSHLLLFLLSDSAAHVTGALIPLTGR